MDKEDRSLDILGIKPISDSVNTIIEKSFDGIEGLLKRVCVPLLDEVGLMMKDKIRLWRLTNILKTLEKAKGKFEFTKDNLELKAHPRIALSIFENASLNDDDEIQELWAGLFVSSCTNDGSDDSNLIFVNLLKQLTKLQAKILKCACEMSIKKVAKNGLIGAETFVITHDELQALFGIRALYHFDRELDHLRSLGLLDPIEAGFYIGCEPPSANITPTPLALNLFVRCNGFHDNPVAYWHLTYQENKEKNDTNDQGTKLL
jgi:hypothetical protein